MKPKFIKCNESFEGCSSIECHHKNPHEEEDGCTEWDYCKATGIPVRCEDCTKEIIISFLNDLSDEERMEIFRVYCISCGSKDPNCKCWNDE